MKMPRRRTTEQEYAVDASTFEQFYRDYYGFVLSRAHMHQCSPDDADDIVQDVFMKAYRAWAKLQPESNLYGWLTVVTLNVIRDRARQQKRQQALPLLEEVCEQELSAQGDPLERLLDQEPIRQAFLRLSTSSQRALLLSLQGYSVQEAAALQAVKGDTSKMRLARARQAFRTAYLHQRPRYKNGRL